MKELDPNTSLKNAIEEEKLQTELFKLSRSGRRATYQIDQLEQGITQHFLEVTCKTNKVTDVRKNRTFQLMDKRPATTGDRRTSRGVHYIPSTEVGTEDRELVYTDQFGRPDIERIHRERADKFYHHKINKLMNMMNERTTKRRAKSAPSSRIPENPQYTIKNLPDTIPEHRPMTRGDAEYELKKMRMSALQQQQKPSMLYGESKEKKGNSRVPSGAKREGSRSSLSRDNSRPQLTREGSRHSISQKSRNASANQKDRRGSAGRGCPSRESVRRGSTAWDADDQDEGRVSSAQRRRTASTMLPRRASFRPPADDSDSSTDTDSDYTPLPSRRAAHRTAPPPRPLTADEAYYNSQGLKLREFQDKRYPSRFLDPNPDFRSRQKPFPILFDHKLQKAYETFCRRTARVKTISESKQDLDEIITKSLEKEEHFEIWEPGYVHKQGWMREGVGNAGGSTDTAKLWDTGPRF